MPLPDDAQLREDFAATSESVQDDAERLVAIENEKQGLDPADPRVDTLSIEAELLAGRIQRESRIERELANEIGSGETRGRKN